MKQSKLFYKTTKEIGEDIQATSHKLLVRAGFIDQLMAGVYTFLPLGLKVLNKIEGIIRKNMVEAPVCGQEVLMPALTPKENWQKTGRWEDFGALFKLKGLGDKDYALGATHEEIVVPLAQKVILSYKDLPLYLFQIQTKFRNEPRAKSGILRTREFVMKDLYSFHTNQEDLDNYYDKVDKSYIKIFNECGIPASGKKVVTFKTWASGGSFSNYSHEYQTLTESGEDTIHICQKCGAAINDEIKFEQKNCLAPRCKSNDFKTAKAVEVGNIFKLGTKYSLPFDLKFRDKDGKEKPVIMGCYGIGLSRILGAIVEVNNDGKGIIWPKNVAPFLVHLIPVENNKKVKDVSEKLYQNLSSFVKTSDGQAKRIEVLYDDREGKSVGEKFSEADLIGIPYRIVVSERTLEKNSVELKERNVQKSQLIKINKILKLLDN
ncbi:hypothetical protein KJ786_02005 [Patescibacteria group bacterium]|nr:hypothetical protein [Patescibacteria group bacterium]